MATVHPVPLFRAVFARAAGRDHVADDLQRGQTLRHWLRLIDDRFGSIEGKIADDRRSGGGPYRARAR